MKKFYITTPIFYINDKPHIGHAYTAFAADTIANYFRFQEFDVFLLTGTDENSQKTLDRASKDNKTPEQFSDEMALKWKDVWKMLKINYDRFIRTSEKQHYVAVQNIIAKINENGDVYKGVYEGLYCTGCEEFKTEKDLVNGDCILHEKKCESIKENNYFFKLSSYTKRITEHIKNNPNFIRPSSSHSEILSMLNLDIKDISISREGNKWGIPIPFDKSQVVYVWFDALINYLTGIGYPSEDYLDYWPADLHLVGKDIVKFHCIIWPAMLMSAGIELPKSIFAHGFFTNEGRKISKSLGNSIDPLEVVEKYGVDALRYYLLSNVIFGGDGDFSFNSLISQYNSDLSDNFGNAIQRIYILAQKNKIDFGINVSSFSAILKRHPEYKNFMDNFQFMEALSYVRDLNSKINKDIQVEAPWTIADNEKLIFVLQDKARRLYESSWLLKPFLPDKVDKAQAILENRLKEENSILFPKIK